MRLLIILPILLLLPACDSDAFFQKLKQPPTQSLSAKSTRGGHDAAIQTAPVSGEIASSTETAAPPMEPIVVKGSGAFAGTAPQSIAGAKANADGDITLNFVNADIRDVIKSVLGDILHVNYVIEPNVSGQVTVKTNQPLTQEELIPTLEQVLSANGIGLLNHDGTFEVTLIQDVKQAPMLGSGGAGYGNQVVRLRHVQADEMTKILGQYSSPSAVTTVGSAPNLVVLTGTTPERAMMLDIINVFDIDRFKGMSFGIFPVTQTDPQTMIDELTKIFSAAVGGDMRSVLDFMPIDRLNAIMVITSDPTRIDQVQTWIKRLDLRVPKDEPRLYVHYVEHGDAKQIATVLKNIFGADIGTPATLDNLKEKGSVAPGLDSMQLSSSTLGMSDTTEVGDGDGENSAEGAQEGADNSYSEQSDAADDSTAVNTSKIRIIPDESNNALFILASPTDYKLIDAALTHLDVTALQVLIEATIAEVTLNDRLKYGVQWFFAHGDHEVTLSDVATGAVVAQFPGFGYTFAGSNAQVVLSALAKATDVKVISSPQIMVLDNKTATLQVGDEVPITTQTAVSVVTPDAPIVNSVELKETGVILKVTPRVNSSGTVGLDIEQEVSDVVPTTTSTIDSPTIRQRKLKSTITVEDGETIALGGLIRDSSTRDRSGIPLLSDIPVLGNLFRANDNIKDRTELLVLITPRVVRNPDEAREITDELRRRVQAVEPLGQKIQ
jgi:general secretion pathway protein D